MSRNYWLELNALILLIFLSGSFATENKSEEAFPDISPEKKLIDYLLANYDPRARPVKNSKDIVNISFSLSLQQIVDLDEKNQLLTTSMYMVWSWEDAFLRWDPAKYDDISNIRLPAKYIWNPDILIYNSAVPSFDQMLKTNVVINSNGVIEWLPPGLFQTTCDVDIHYFPFDDQHCLIKFGTWSHHGGVVDMALSQAKAITDDYVESGEWYLMSMIGKRNSISYDCCPDPFIDITYDIHLRRRTLFHGFNLILPCVLICFLTILVFVLPADCGERITLGITILLALVVFLQLVAETLPPSAVIPLLGKYFACSIVMVTTAVLATVISLNFHHTNPSNTTRMPGYIRLIFLKTLPKILRMKRPGENSSKRKLLEKSDSDLSIKHTEDFPLVSVGESELNNWQTGNGIETKSLNSESGKALTELQDSQKEMHDILEEIKFITSRMHGDDEDEQSAMEWQFAATVLDKFCLWFFTLYLVITTLLTIGIAPGVLSPYPESA